MRLLRGYLLIILVLVLLLRRRLLSNGHLRNVFELGSKRRRQLWLHDNLIWHGRQFRLKCLEHDRYIELQRLQLLHLHLPPFQILKRIVLLLLITIQIIVLVIMLSDDIKLPQVVDERSLDVRQLFVLLDLLIGLEEEIGP